MSIFEEIKNSGLDIFINYHPKVIDFKRKSKELHKTLKKTKSLMQCQEAIAKQNGFNNWHHFMAIIKKHYQKDLESNFLVTKDLQKHSENLLLGHDINFNNYKWQDPSSLRLHQLIITDKYQEYNVFLMKQIINNNKKLIVVNPNKESVDSIINEAIKNNREKDIKIFNFAQEETYKQYECFLNNHINLNSGGLGELLLSIYGENYYDNEDRDRVIGFISALSMLVVFLRDEKNIILNFDLIKNYMVFDNLFNIYKNDKKIPHYIKSVLISYFSMLPQFDENKTKQSDTTMEQHGCIQMSLTKIIGVLEYSNMFTQKGSDWKSLFTNEENDIKIFYFNNKNQIDKETLDKFIINLIKSSLISKLGASIEGSYISKGISNKDNKYLFLIDSYLHRGVSIIPGQARGVGLCINFSYDSIKSFTDKTDIDELPYVVGNLNTKIISNENRAPLLEITPLINIEIDEEILVNKTNDNKNVLWIVRKDECHQVDFDN